MARRVLLTGWLLLVAAVLSGCGGRPQIAVAETSLALGDVVNGEVVTREIAVQNDGRGELVIAAVTTSCGCTQARVEPATIPPGGRGVLTIDFDSGAHGPDLTGELIRQVFIMSNDPQQPETVVELVANILPPDS